MILFLSSNVPALPSSLLPMAPQPPLQFPVVHTSSPHQMSPSPPKPRLPDCAWHHHHHIDRLTALIAQIWMDQECLHTAQSEEESDHLPAVAKIIDKKVDTTVDGEEEVTKQLGADGNRLE